MSRLRVKGCRGDGSPLSGLNGLELHAEGKLQLPHAMFASILVITPPAEQSTQRAPEAFWYVERGMIEDVEGLELELTLYVLLYRDVLQECSVRHVLTGPAKALRPTLPKVAAGRPNGLEPVPTGVVDGAKN